MATTGTTSAFKSPAAEVREDGGAEVGKRWSRWWDGGIVGWWGPGRVVSCRAAEGDAGGARALLPARRWVEALARAQHLLLLHVGRMGGVDSRAVASLAWDACAGSGRVSQKLPGTGLIDTG